MASSPTAPAPTLMVSIAPNLASVAPDLAHMDHTLAPMVSIYSAPAAMAHDSHVHESD